MSSRSKLLLMVDDAALKSSLVQHLSKAHYQVSSVESDFMQKVFDEVPHLLIIDDKCSNGQGPKIALAIKNDVVLKYIPVILLASDAGAVSAYKAQGIDFVIARNPEANELVLQVRKALSQNYNELDLNPLTHLPGARSSVLRMERALHAKRKFAICCVDLSELAAFNSAYGDARGDQVIIRLAEIIQTVLHAESAGEHFLGHLGGDDFVVVTDSASAERLSDAIMKHFDEAVPNFYDAHDRKQGHILQRNKDGILTRYPIMSVSIAIVHNDYGNLNEISDVSRVAGELKRYMKALQGSCYMKDRRHTPRVSVDLGYDLSFEAHLPGKMKSVKVSSALRNTEAYAGVFNTILKGRKLRTNYQPIVDLKTKKIVGYEALTAPLVEHPLKDATLFFETARELGKTKELDGLCVELALKNGQSLESERKLFLNLNHETLIDARIMKSIFAAKGVIGFKNLVIEVTEQSILRSFGKVRDALLELKEQGVSVAIDDVGGGAVSLRDVAILKPDYMKFDRSLIRQIDASPTKQQIVLSLIVFANGIQAITTAEGIETREEYAAVLDCGVHLGQGYYFARPGQPFPEVS